MTSCLGKGPKTGSLLLLLRLIRQCTELVFCLLEERRRFLGKCSTSWVA